MSRTERPAFQQRFVEVGIPALLAAGFAASLLIGAEPAAPALAEPAVPAQVAPPAPKQVAPVAPKPAEPAVPALVEPVYPANVQPASPAAVQPPAPVQNPPPSPATRLPNYPAVANPRIPAVVNPPSPAPRTPIAPNVAEPRVPALATPADAAVASLRLLPATAAAPARFEARGLPPEQTAAVAGIEPDDPHWQRLFVVTVVPEGTLEAPAEALPPVAGKYVLAEGVVRFTPAFAPRPGTRYRAVSFDSAGRAVDSAVLSLPAPPPAAPTSVSAVFPTAETIPENLLRFYVQFSAPMSRGEAYERLRLKDDRGQEVDLAVLEVGEELWDRDGKRLTLLLDPGRIKRGVKPREDLGTALVAGRRFTLEVDQAWRDADGKPLAAAATKSFAVSPPVREAIDPAQWRVSSPAAGAREPLVVRFPRPLDRALVERTFTVESPAGTAVPGVVTIADAERAWSFQPDRPWPAGEGIVSIDPALEDVAGNRIGRAFEVLLVGPAPTSEPGAAPQAYRLPFRTAAPPPAPAP